MQMKKFKKSASMSAQFCYWLLPLALIFINADCTQVVGDLKHSEDGIHLWGSRVVPTPHGPTDPMYMDHKTNAVSTPTAFSVRKEQSLMHSTCIDFKFQDIFLYTVDDYVPIDIENGKCVDQNDKFEWGSNCQLKNGNSELVCSVIE